uniref:Uncharacterized protein n=1 Tax=Panagrolaimus sp. ES5 TaxID=591445 RepID=A0AC34F613_9BILA
MNDSEIDLIEEYQKEEERLRNTRSPFTAIDDFRSMNRAQTGTPNSMIGNGNSRYGRGTTPTSQQQQQQIIRSKPPTPPPRERSKSPTIRSPQPFRKSQTPSAYQQERSRIASSEYLSDDDDDTTEFSHLHSLDSLSRGGASPYASIDSPRVGGASASSTPLPFSPGRSETPAFPVSNRETPLPFHPLLYQGADNNSQQQQQTSGFNSLVHRSNSPRSMYYGQSRRSSMTSVGWFYILC